MTAVEKEFVPYTQALELKELGFDKPCLAYWFNETPTNPHSQKLVPIGQCIIYYKKPWDNEKIVKDVIREYCSAPTFSQAFRFFRDKYEIYYTIEGSKKFGFQHFIYDEKESYEIKSEETFKDYEVAELACLKKLIEIVKNKKL